MKIKKTIAFLLACILISAFTGFTIYSGYHFYLVARVDLPGFLKALGIAIILLCGGCSLGILCVWIEQALKEKK